MATAKLLQIADAIAADLAVVSLSVPFKVERTFVPRRTVADLQRTQLETVRVSVVPSGETPTELSRSQERIVYTIDVGIHAYAARMSQGGDELIRLGEEIGEHFRRSKLTTASGTATCQSRQTIAVAVPEHLDQFGVMTTIQRQTWFMDSAV